jgi:hypothetical protein
VKIFEFDFLKAHASLSKEAMGYMMEGLARKLRGEELLLFVETRLVEKIGAMILVGLEFQINERSV